MKKILFLSALFVSLCLSSYSQEGKDSTGYQPAPTFDSGTVKLQISFKLRHHLDIIEAQRQSGTIAQPETMNYANQVWRQMDTAFTSAALDSLITVTVSSAFIRDNYRLMGSQQERITAEVNAEMKEALFPQITSYSWLYAEIVKIATENQSLIDRRRHSAYEAGKAVLQ